MPASAAPGELPNLRFYEPGDLRGLLELFEAAFPGWPTVPIRVPAIEHLSWKLSGELEAPRYTVVAEADGRLVGARPFLIWPTKVRGRVVRLRNGFDTCVHPDYQGSGLMTRMRAYCRERFQAEVDLHIGYGEHPAFTSLRKREDMRPFGNELDVLTLDLPVRHSLARHAWQIEDVERFDRRMDAFFAIASEPFDFIVERSERFLNWRYADPRAGINRRRAASLAGELLGYTVLSASKGRAHIADVLALPGRLDVVAALVDDAIAYAMREQATALDCWLPDQHPYRGALIDRGFRHKRRLKPVYLPLRLPPGDLAFLADRNAAVHFVLGDTDLV
jgi:hypothetical protein